jgi:hypothetical protein
MLQNLKNDNKRITDIDDGTQMCYLPLWMKYKSQASGQQQETVICF